MISLRWAPYPEADVANYKVYRSIIGFQAPIVSLASGATLLLKINGGSLQTFTFDGSTPIVDLLNATLISAHAYLSDDELSFFVRTDNRTASGSVEIVGGSALSDLGLVPEFYGERTDVKLIATVDALGDPTQLVTYQDPDGVLQDWYAVSTVDSHDNESLKTNLRQPIQTTGDICVIEGIVIGLQGDRVADAIIKATIFDEPQNTTNATSITREPIQVLSGTDGRYSIPVLQGIFIQLEIEATGFSRTILVPNQPYIFVNDLQTDTDYRYPTEFQPS